MRPSDTPGPSRPALEYAIISLILGGVGFVTSPLIILARLPGIFPPIMLGLAVIGVGALGLVMAIFGMIRTVSQRLESFWHVLAGLVLCGLSIICGLTMFIAALTIPSGPMR
jgi:hypothetical protein